MAGVHDAPAHRRLLRLLAGLLIVTSSSCRPPAPADAPADAVGDAAVAGPEVLRALRAGGEAHVVIALASPPSGAASGAATGAASGAALSPGTIARLQAELLRELTPDDYQSTQLFAAVPAMAGTVRSERGLRRILAHPNVRRVDLDAGGRGGEPASP